MIDGMDVTKDLLAFAQDLVRIQSYSGQEEQVARLHRRQNGSFGL